MLPGILVAQVMPGVAGGAGCLTPIFILVLPGLLLWQIVVTAIAALTRRRASPASIALTWWSGLVGSGIGAVFSVFFLLGGASEEPNFFEWLALALFATAVLCLVATRRPPAEAQTARSKRRRRLTVTLAATLCALLVLAALARLYLDLRERAAFWREYLSQPGP